MRASAAEFILEGLYSHRRISRSEEYQFSGEEKRAPAREKRDERDERDRERERRRRQFN